MQEKGSKVLKGEKKDYKINVILVNDSYMTELNRLYLSHTGTTDVISFPFYEKNLWGEIYICVPQALRQAKEYKTEPHQELERLLIHGILHLLGYNHQGHKEALLMEKKTLKYLGK